MSDLKAGRKKSISSDILQEMADYLHEPVDVLMGRTQFTATEYSGAELDELRQALRERPEMKMLFDAGMKATPQTVRQTAQFLEGLANGESSD